MNVSNLEINGEGRVAWKSCEFVTTYQQHGAALPATDCGTHLWVLHKTDAGAWRIVVATWTLV